MCAPRVTAGSLFCLPDDYVHAMPDSGTPPAAVNDMNPAPPDLSTRDQGQDLIDMKADPKDTSRDLDMDVLDLALPDMEDVTDLGGMGDLDELRCADDGTCICGSGRVPDDMGGCLDINGCDPSPCAPYVACTDVLAPGTGAECGACPYHSVGDGMTCEPPLLVTSDQTHRCLLLADGTVRCWGNNYSGQLGDGTQVSTWGVSVASGSITQAIDLDAGIDHTCAVLSSRQVLCWGINVSGQLGDGTTTGRRVPTPVQGLTQVTQVSAGWAHSCAVWMGGQVTCWGRNSDGQLGDGTSQSHLTPVPVPGITQAMEVSAGRDHTCALLSSGQVSCWGANDQGQLGQGTTTTLLMPVTVQGLTDVIKIDAGTYYTCALRATGEVTCWGAHHATRQEGWRTAPPFTMPELEDVVDIAANSVHTCALKSDGTTWCWGSDYQRSLGSHVTGQSQVPVQVERLEGSIALSPLCTFDHLGEVRCWGRQQFAQTVDHYSLSAQVDVGARHSCALQKTGLITCWGDNQQGQLGHDPTTLPLVFEPVDIPGVNDARAVELGSQHTCALLPDHTLACWGDNTHGQLGDGTTSSSFLPVTVQGIGDVASVALGEGHSCAVLHTGEVACWGTNLEGQLGESSLMPHALPVLVAGISTAVEIAVSSTHSCARLANGTITCWGANMYGQLGDGTTLSRATPVAVQGITQAKGLEVSDAHSCAVLEDQSITCWGRNQSGQLGDGSLTSSAVPVLVPDIQNVAEVGLGQDYTCVRLHSGQVRCIGARRFYQLGDGGSEQGRTTRPVWVNHITDAQELDVGAHHACVRQQDSRVLCWGSFEEGRLGERGIYRSSTSPQPVRF